MGNVGEINECVAFLGYRQFLDGSKGPAEIQNLIKNVGDKIIAVDGVSTIKKTFKEVILMLRESGKNRFAHMRFLINKYSQCNNELNSMGSIGHYMVYQIKRNIRSDRRRLLSQREMMREKNNILNKKGGKVDCDQHVGSDENSDADGSDEDASDDDFDLVSVDEDVAITQNSRKHT